MTARLGTEIFEPGIELEFGDQSAMKIWQKKVGQYESILRECSSARNGKGFETILRMCLKDGSMHTQGIEGRPMVSLQILIKPQTKGKANSIKEGNLLVHHAGHKSLRAQRMSPWMDVAE